MKTSELTVGDRYMVRSHVANNLVDTVCLEISPSDGFIRWEGIGWKPVASIYVLERLQRQSTEQETYK